MNRVMLTIILLTVGLVTVAYAADINGAWKSSMVGPDGSAMDMVFTFKVDGEALSGNIASTMGDMPFTGKVNGNNFTFSIDFEGMSIDHQCVVAGDSITVTVPDMGGGPMSMILKRDAPAK